MELATTLYYLAFIPAIVLAITFHEFAHARVALAFGDRTAYEQGRVTLNPLAHVDPIGLLGIIFAGFGWGRPVPVDVRQLRHPKANLLVSAAGPGANLLMAALAGLAIRIPGALEGLRAAGALDGAKIFVPMFIHLNLVLACFNFLPLGPLDGAHVLESLLPSPYAIRFRNFNRQMGYGLLLILILSSYVLPFSPLSLILAPLINFFSSLLLT
mgnify:CR=1 FL=1